jgi:hypothetical protein
MLECDKCFCWHCEKRYNESCSYENDCKHVPRVECDDYEELRPETMFLLMLSDVLSGRVSNPHLDSVKRDFPVSLN